MKKLNRWTRSLAFVPTIAALSLLAACGDDPVEPGDPAEEIATIRITIGANTANLNVDGTAISGIPIVIPAGTHPVTATFLDDAGASLNAELGEFEMRLTPANTAVLTFARTGAFAGTVTRVAAGSTNLSFVLWHLAENHEDIGPWPVNVTVQ
jgi:hypothetical protein